MAYLVGAYGIVFLLAVYGYGSLVPRGKPGTVVETLALGLVLLVTLGGVANALHLATTPFMVVTLVPGWALAALLIVSFHDSLATRIAYLYRHGNQLAFASPERMAYDARRTRELLGGDGHLASRFVQESIPAGARILTYGVDALHLDLERNPVVVFDIPPLAAPHLAFRGFTDSKAWEAFAAEQQIDYILWIFKRGERQEIAAQQASESAVDRTFGRGRMAFDRWLWTLANSDALRYHREPWIVLKVPTGAERDATIKPYPPASPTSTPADHGAKERDRMHASRDTEAVTGQAGGRQPDR